MDFKRNINISDTRDQESKIKKSSIRPYEFPPVMNSYLDIQLPSTSDFYED